LGAAVAALVPWSENVGAGVSTGVDALSAEARPAPAAALAFGCREERERERDGDEGA
jgi:hypothetical protein